MFLSFTFHERCVLQNFAMRDSCWPRIFKALLACGFWRRSTRRLRRCCSRAMPASRMGVKAWDDTPRSEDWCSVTGRREISVFIQGHCVLARSFRCNLKIDFMEMSISCLRRGPSFVVIKNTCHVMTSVQGKNDALIHIRDPCAF